MTTRIIRGKGAPERSKKPDDSRKVAALLAANNKIQVDAELAKLRHPLKAEILAVRAIIKGVDSRISEQWKWAAPSFSYRHYLVTFNLRAKEKVHLVFHNGAILDDQEGFLQGDYPDRRMAYFADMADVRAKKPMLVKAIEQWIELMDKKA